MLACGHMASSNEIRLFICTSHFDIVTKRPLHYMLSIVAAKIGRSYCTLREAQSKTQACCPATTVLECISATTTFAVRFFFIKLFKLGVSVANELFSPFFTAACTSGCMNGVCAKDVDFWYNLMLSTN
jgi:hypothetical protein